MRSFTGALKRLYRTRHPSATTTAAVATTADAAPTAAAAAPAAAAQADAHAAVCRQLRDLISRLEAPGGAAWSPALLSGRLRAIAAQLEAAAAGAATDGAAAAAAAAGGTGDATNTAVSPADIEHLERSYQASTSATVTPAAAAASAPTKRQRRSRGGDAAAAPSGGVVQKAMDFGKYRQRYVALHVMYLGGGYQGLARQADSENTIEGHLFRALRQVRLIPPDVEPGALAYSRCGRTDKGVSALGQVLALRLRSNGRVDAPPLTADKEADYAAALNRVLPDDIRVLGWADVDDEFNARFSCLARRYKYFIIQDGTLNIEAMRDAAARLVGEHDFRNFCKPDVAQVRNFCRTIAHASLEPVAATAGGCQAYVLNLRGTAFLWHQVRCIAAVLLMVGRGLEPPSVVSDLLSIRQTPAKPQYAFASDLPLLLHACEFEGVPWVRRGRALARAAADVKAHMERHLVGAAMCGAVLDTLAPDLTAAVAATGAVQDLSSASAAAANGTAAAVAAAANGTAATAAADGGQGQEGAAAAALLGRAAVAAAAAGHVPLLSPGRPKEAPLEERFVKLGIPLELLNQPGKAGFAEGE